jgi:FlaA1/EpsC-like NDP-sugar epimerase
VRTLIYGAGESGRQLLNLLRQGVELHPVAFIDDEKKLFKTIVNGLTVYSKQDLPSLIARKKIGKVLLAMPSASRTERKKIIDSLIELPIEVLSIHLFTSK